MTFTPQDAARIRAAAEEMIARHRLPGIAVGVVQGDDVVFCEAFGYAEIERKHPFTIDRRQRIASITKTMVGLCLMALVDEGKLSLDDRIVELLPDVGFRGPAEGITLRHLLTHTSGIGEAPTPERLRDVASPARAHVMPPGAFETLYPDGIVVEVPPGTKWAYCNNGYALLGEVVSRAEGASLQDVMQRRLWGPLGMADTDILDENDERITACYHRAPSEDNRFQLQRAGIDVPDEPTVDGVNIRGEFRADFNQGMRAAGGVQSTLPDMLTYASALLRQGGGVVRPATFAQMTSSHVRADVRMVDWGLSFARNPLRTRSVAPRDWPALIGHGGAYFGGWNSHLDILPEQDVGVVIHMNIMLDAPEPVFRHIHRAVLDLPDASYPPRATDRQLLGTAPGTYELPMPGPLTNFRPQTRVGRITVAAEGDRLVLRSRWGNWKQGVPLTPCDEQDPGFFAIEQEGFEPKYVAFQRDEAGAVTALHLDDLVVMGRREAE